MGDDEYMSDEDMSDAASVMLSCIYSFLIYPRTSMYSDSHSQEEDDGQAIYYDE